jgi:hypothetical protein
MRSSSVARVVMATLGVAVAFTLGCGKPPTGPSPPETPPPPPSFDTRTLSAQQLAAFALYESAGLHEGVTASALIWAAEEGKVLTNGPCAFGQGLMQGSLDGGVSPTAGAFLPTGSHTYVVSFKNCGVGWGGEVGLNGVASAAYNAAQWSNVTATVSADSMRGEGLDSYGLLNDVTADGSAVWTRVGSFSSTLTTTYTPATGSRLVNNSTTKVATFGGGSYSHISYPGNRWDQRFDNLKVAINGTEYTLNGSLEQTIGNTGNGSNESPYRSYTTHTGEIRITNSGTLVARIYGDVRKALIIEVLVPLVPF